MAEGDTVATRWVARETRRGEFMGIPPSEKSVPIPGIQIDRLSNGRLVEHWLLADDVGMLERLGAMPGPFHCQCALLR